MLKKTFIVIALIALTTMPFVHGQSNEYIPFPDSAIWRVDYHQFEVVQAPYNVKYYFQYYNLGDTLIDSYVYKKIFKSRDSIEVLQWALPIDTPRSSPAHYVGALRDDSISNKTFFIFANTNTDSLLFDYNLNVGDTLKGITSSAPFMSLVVASVDSVLVNGQFRKRWNFNQCNNNNLFVIEGIGSNAGLIEPLCIASASIDSKHLVCIKDSTLILFESDYLSSIGCQIIAAGLPEIDFENNLTCFPNPFSTQLKLHSDKILNDATLTLFNAYGQQVKQILNISGQSITLHRDNLKCGLYFVRITQDRKIVMMKKIIITDNK